jgi:lipopolysaccharide biosynthesis regulator YciM
MLTAIDRAEASPAALESPADDIEVRPARSHEASIIAAAKAWARALQAAQRENASGEEGESAELALYGALADADALKSAELALYQAVLASSPI